MTRSKSATNGRGFQAYIHRLGLEAPMRTTDPTGGAEVTYALVSEVWGEVRAISADETLTHDRVAATLTHIVSIRYREGLSTENRFRFGNRRLAIRGVLDRDGRRRHLECRCEEIVT